MQTTAKNTDFGSNPSKKKKKSVETYTSSVVDSPLSTGEFSPKTQYHPLKSLKKDNILALDVATKTGFATSTGSGFWNFEPKRDESKGMRLIRFRAKLNEMASLMDLKLITFEMVSGFHKNAIIVAAEMIGIMKIFCEEKGIEYRSYPSKTIKKWATGNGNAGKPLMVQTARKKWNMQSESDDEADALAIFHYTLEDLSLEEQKPII